MTGSGVQLLADLGPGRPFEVARHKRERPRLLQAIPFLRDRPSGARAHPVRVAVDDDHPPFARTFGPGDEPRVDRLVPKAVSDHEHVVGCGEGLVEAEVLVCQATVFGDGGCTT